MSDELGIQAIRLGEPADGLGEGSDLRRVDDRERQAGGGQRCRDGGLEPARRFQHDQFGPDRAQARHELLEAGPVTADREGLGSRPQVHIEPIP